MTVTAIALKVCASALKIFPQFNASIDLTKKRSSTNSYINIGVAVDTDRGLLVPVIRDVGQEKYCRACWPSLRRLSKKAATKSSLRPIWKAATFTITNFGGIGGTGFSPIVNYPEVAILGLSRSSMEPIWMNEKFEPRLSSAVLALIRSSPDRRCRRRPLPALDCGSIRTAVPAFGSGIGERH